MHTDKTLISAPFKVHGLIDLNASTMIAKLMLYSVFFVLKLYLLEQ